MNIYSSRYNKLIEHYKLNPPESQFENHHIYPKSLYPEFKNEKWNLVRLPYKAHFIAHLLLHKIYGGKMTQAYYMMCNRLGKKNSKSYEYARLFHRNAMMGNKRSNIACRNPNADGSQAKKAWAASTSERRKKQSSICISNNKKHKSKPKEIRSYNCSWCDNTVVKEEFIHHKAKPHYYCNTTCRNRRSWGKMKCPV